MTDTGPINQGDFCMENLQDIMTKARGGHHYPEYLALISEIAKGDPSGLDPEAAEKLSFTALNLHRSQRIERTWRPTPELAKALNNLPGPQLWLALTEPWCGDSAQCLPVFAVLADSREDIELRLLLRDQNPEFMDRFLTHGKRSIPVVIGLDPDGRERFRWGPRPQAAQAVFDEAKAAGLEKPDILERLHLFYGRNRGQALDAELVTLWNGAE